jgi:hypothetical protein
VGRVFQGEHGRGGDGAGAAGGAAEGPADADEGFIRAVRKSPASPSSAPGMKS